LVLGVVALLAPNTAQLMRRERPALDYPPEEAKAGGWRWSPSPAWGMGVALLSACGLLSLMRATEFLYFQF
jgi:hypothetical protein